jgi:hypothetical protein
MFGPLVWYDSLCQVFVSGYATYRELERKWSHAAQIQFLVIRFSAARGQSIRGKPAP